MTPNTIDARNLMEAVEHDLLVRHHMTLQEATPVALHDAVAEAVLEAITPVWMESEKKRQAKKSACYLSAEYLIGRLVYSNLLNMGVLEDMQRLMREKGSDLNLLESIEDAALGNGGLGRLAACFMDSAATLSLPLMGYGLRYRYGLFRQSFRDGKQMEEADDWSRMGDPWSIRRLDEAVVVSMKTGDVLAVPYDIPIIGYHLHSVGTLRLWQCESVESIDFSLFNEQKYAKSQAAMQKAENITLFLYPNDDHREGKRMRVQQQYVLVSASMQDMFRAYEKRHGKDYRFFAEEYAVQLNDTHPVMAIPEMIRLLEKEGMTFQDAFSLARETFAYTNHTVMQEALEKWDLSLLNSVCPEIVRILHRIDLHFMADMHDAGKQPSEHLCVLRNHQVHMAQLAVYATHATNGVAEIHSGLLKTDLFREWYALYPERFQNKTNGITPRRWLGLCNPELTHLLQAYTGEDFLENLPALAALKPKIDEEMIDAFWKVKRQKKAQLCALVRKETGMEISPDMCFDIQVKRLHEYKRQFMNALSILAFYHGIKDGTIRDFPPTVFFFGAKAAAGYARAKAIIYLINQIAAMVNADPEVSPFLRVVFLPNYNCSLAEIMIPAADLSEQISPAGTEASGTGNMKFMLNGAPTLGTYDGANVEIVQEAGRENNYIFGATVEELAALKDTYDPKAIYEKNPVIHTVLDDLVNGLIPDPDGVLKELYDSILVGASWHKPDHYFLLKDFPDYLATKEKAIRDHRDDPRGFGRKCLMNIFSAGMFSSDRTVSAYAKEIWHITPME